MELLDFENHVKLIIAVFVVMWLFECGNLTIQHIFKNCYFFEDLGENIFRTCCHVSGLVQYKKIRTYMSEFMENLQFVH